MQISNFKFQISKSGVASLPVILLLGVIIVEIGIATTFLLSYLNTSLYGIRLSNQALAAAHSGVNDAISKIILNKNCGADVSCPATPYTFAVGSTTAEVSICKDACSGSPQIVPGQDKIVSVGRALTKQQRVVAVVSVDSTTGLVTIDSIQELPQ